MHHHIYKILSKFFISSEGHFADIIEDCPNVERRLAIIENISELFWSAVTSNNHVSNDPNHLI